MARTALPAANILAIARDSWQSPPAGFAATANMYIQCTGASPQTVIQNPAGLTIFIIVGTTATTVTLRASASGVNVAGSAQTAWQPPSNTVFTQSAAGDLVSAAVTSQTIQAGPFTTDRFTQPDGNIYLDFSQVTGVTVYATQAPFVAV